MNTLSNSKESNFLNLKSAKTLLTVNAVLAILYFLLITFWFPRGNSIFFGALVFGEIFHLWQVLTYLYTVWEVRQPNKLDKNYTPPVDVFITVAGEPIDIVEETVLAAKKMTYPNFEIYILNDGLVANLENWKEPEVLAKKLGVKCITREIAGGAKAGNINNGMRESKNDFVVIFDADHVPHPDFLEKTMGYFADNKVGFVQSPQYYKNHRENYITAGSWEQQELFFGAICEGKMRLNSVPMCGTNMAIRRSALDEVGGINETNIAEDFLTGMLIHEKGWKSVYVPEILAEGLAPRDFLSYYKQQFRWARGSLEVIFNYNPLFRRGLSFAQKIQYLASASYYLTGTIVLLNALFPLVFFYTGLVPFQTSTMALAVIFLPYIFTTVYVLKQTSNNVYTFRAVAFSIGGFVIHLQALVAVLLKQKSAFKVTAKNAQEGNFLYLAAPHLVYIGLVFIGVAVAIAREGLSASVTTNATWALFNIVLFMPFILAASPALADLPGIRNIFQFDSKTATKL